MSIRRGGGRRYRMTHSFGPRRRPEPKRGPTTSRRPHAVRVAGCRERSRYIAEMFSPQSVSEATFAQLARHFTPRQITDISMSAAYYRALGTMVMAFGVEMESPEVLATERDWQKKSLP